MINWSLRCFNQHLQHVGMKLIIGWFIICRIVQHALYDYVQKHCDLYVCSIQHKEYTVVVFGPIWKYTVWVFTLLNYHINTPGWTKNRWKSLEKQWTWSSFLCTTVWVCIRSAILHKHTVTQVQQHMDMSLKTFFSGDISCKKQNVFKCVNRWWWYDFKGKTHQCNSEQQHKGVFTLHSFDLQNCANSSTDSCCSAHHIRNRPHSLVYVLMIRVHRVQIHCTEIQRTFSDFNQVLFHQPAFLNTANGTAATSRLQAGSLCSYKHRPVRRQDHRTASSGCVDCTNAG